MLIVECEQSRYNGGLVSRKQTMTTPFIRDRLTWLNYLMLAFYGYTIASLGPIIPFLGDELKLNYTVKGLHLSAFALGMFLAGVSADRAANRLGRRHVFWLGSGMMAFSSLLFILARRPELTIPSTLGMGFFGSYTLVIIQATLSDHHGANRAIALTEVNVIAAIGSGFSPLLVGRFEAWAVGWRLMLVVSMVYWVLLWVLYWRGTPFPDAPPAATTQTSPRLPFIFWAYWVVAFLGVAIEWSTVFWGADFLRTNAGISQAGAATIMSVFFVAVVIGRAAGSGLARRFALQKLLLGAFLLTAAGFIPYWLSPSTTVSVVGLFVAGLGISNLFPLALSMATSVVAPNQTNAASSRVVMGSGGAIILAPQMLGTLADQSSIYSAYAIVVVLLFLAVGVILWANRLPNSSIVAASH